MMPRILDTAPPNDAKEAAIRCWSTDPCGSNLVIGEPGTSAYIEKLIEARFDYAPWMYEDLNFDSVSGLHVLDVGCGQGIDLVTFARAGARVSGIDLTPRHVELARSHLAAAGCTGRVVQGDAESLPFPDSFVDRVSSNGVLHHTPDMRRALSEVYRVLRPGGEVRLVVYNRNSLHYWTQVLWYGVCRGGLVRDRSLRRVLSRVEYSRIDASPYVRPYTRNELVRLLSEAGFRDIDARIRHFRSTDTPLTHFLSKYLPPLRRQDVLDRIGRSVGWYVVVTARRP